MATLTFRESDAIPKEDFKNIRFVRSDRNGSKYYSALEVCQNCKETGYIEYYSFYADGICFRCKGAGHKDVTLKVITDSYASKLENERARKEEKREAERAADAPRLNERFLLEHGFSKDGKAYAVEGNTYEIKDELKAKGARFHARVWYFSEPHSEYDCVEAKAENCFYADNLGLYLGWKDIWDNELCNCVKNREKSYKKSLDNTVSDVVSLEQPRDDSDVSEFLDELFN